MLGCMGVEMRAMQLYLYLIIGVACVYGGRVIDKLGMERNEDFGNTGSSSPSHVIEELANKINLSIEKILEETKAITDKAETLKLRDDVKQEKMQKELMENSISNTRPKKRFADLENGYEYPNNIKSVNLPSNKILEDSDQFDLDVISDYFDDDNNDDKMLSEISEVTKEVASELYNNKRKRRNFQYHRNRNDHKTFSNNFPQIQESQDQDDHYNDYENDENYDDNSDDFSEDELDDKTRDYNDNVNKHVSENPETSAFEDHEVREGTNEEQSTENGFDYTNEEPNTKYKNDKSDQHVGGNTKTETIGINKNSQIEKEFRTGTPKPEVMETKQIQIESDVFEDDKTECRCECTHKHIPVDARIQSRIKDILNALAKKKRQTRTLGNSNILF